MISIYAYVHFVKTRLSGNKVLPTKTDVIDGVVEQTKTKRDVNSLAPLRVLSVVPT
jgi:hypothetical protein